jgi:hypothetical protein
MKRHPYYIPKAIERIAEYRPAEELVPVASQYLDCSALKNCVGKKSNAWYVAKVRL